MLNLLVTPIVDSEEKTHPAGLSANPVLARRKLTDGDKLKQTDLLGIFTLRGVVSQVHNGNR